MIRAQQLRAVLIPVGVAVLSFAALAWYGMYWIPAKQRYLDERNVRLLRTIGAQVRVKVNNFDQAIDNAIESLALTSDRASLKGFSAYMKRFAPALEIIDTTEDRPRVAFDDPPRVKIILDEGKHYMYLGYEHGFTSDGKTKNHVSARADIEAAVGSYLSSHPEFDVLALVDFDGRVIAQQSVTGVELTRLDKLSTSATPGGAANGRIPSGANTSRIENVTIGGADYRFYVQAVQLSLLRDEEKGDEPEEWRLVGLVRADHFRSASAEISSTYWLMLLAIVAVLLLAIPVLKLQVLHPRERFHDVDGVAIVATSFLIAGLATFALLDVYYFGDRNARNSDVRLKRLTENLSASVATEVRAAAEELDRQWISLKDELNREPRVDTITRPILVMRRDTISCSLRLSCRTDVLLDSAVADTTRYPYFRLIAWSDPHGWQRYKWTSARTVTPFVNNRAQPYWDDVRRARRFSDDSLVPQRGVSVVRSQNTSEVLTTIWRALPRESPGNLMAATLVTAPVSVTHPLLPWGVQFAVVNTTGQVLYHSDEARSLNENFFQEARDDATLRAAVLGRSSGSLTAEYFGQRYRMYVAPIDVSSADHRLADPRWSLIVFERALIPETVNLETVTLAIFLFLGYSVVVAIGWAVVRAAWPRETAKWFWPDARKTIAYGRVAALNGILGLTFLLIVAHLGPARLLGATALISFGALAATFCIVGPAKKSDEGSPRTLFHEYLLARVSLLFVVAVVPAMASFQVAQSFESGLLLERQSMHRSAERVARTAHVEKQMRLMRLCRGGDGCAEAAAFLHRRLADTAYDVHDAADTPAIAESPTSARWLVSLLASGHRAYNDIAVDLQAALPGNSAADVEPGFGYPVLGALLALLLVLVVRFLVWPLFAIDLYWPPGFATSGSYKANGNVPPDGPADSGDIDIPARRTPRTSDFDVGTLAFAAVANGAPLPGLGAIHTPRAEPAQTGTAARFDAPPVDAAGEVDAVSEAILREEASARSELRSIADDLKRALPTNPSPSRGDILFEFGLAAESHYRALFDACSPDQKLALHQLAVAGVVNPRNRTVVGQLLRSRLVRRDPTFRLMNETFRRFVAHELSHEKAAEWEREGVRLPWGSISTTMLTVALGMVGVVLLTQQQLVGAWIGYLPALTPMVPNVVKLISSVPFIQKKGGGGAVLT